ncbi:hypothetical protein ACYOEI_12525 [Singulisphaera rosea]
MTAPVRTASTLSGRLSDDEATRALRLMIGVDRGSALAANVNDQLDDFGTTARRVWRVLDHARGVDFVLTQAVASDPEVAGLLNKGGAIAEVVSIDFDSPSRATRIRPEADSQGHPALGFTGS